MQLWHIRTGQRRKQPLLYSVMCELRTPVGSVFLLTKQLEKLTNLGAVQHSLLHVTAVSHLAYFASQRINLMHQLRLCWPSYRRITWLHVLPNQLPVI